MVATRTDNEDLVNSVTPNLGAAFPEAGGFPQGFPRELLRPAALALRVNDPAGAAGTTERTGWFFRGVPVAIAALALSLVVTGCLAVEEESIEAPAAPAYVEPLQGLVIDRTITFFGRDFYARFMDAWREQPENGKLDLAIIERPDPRFGSEITIEANRKVEFRAFLSPTRARTRALAESAAAMLAQRLALTPAQRRAVEGPDLAADEL